MDGAKLYGWTSAFLERMYVGPDARVERRAVITLAMMVTGLVMGPHVQLFAIALWLPFPVQLASMVRRFERLLADSELEPKRYFEPFVISMRRCLGNETAYLLIDCTKAGSSCRTLFIGLAYQHTVLPVVWKTVTGNKGNVTSEIHVALLNEVYPLFRDHKQVVVLGDGEFSNGEMIKWLLNAKWQFVLRFKSSYAIKPKGRQAWEEAAWLVKEQQLEPGSLHHWEEISFMKCHGIEDLTMTVHWGSKQAEPLYLVSNLPASANPHLIYQRRYWIETLFSNEKSRGFELARTHLTIPAQIDRLMLAIAIATCIVLGIGTHLLLTNQTSQVDRTNRRDLSLFQLGFRALVRAVVLDHLDRLRLELRWDLKLPAPGYLHAT